MTDLTPKQEAFCKEYLIDLNGTQAAIRAGYSEKSAAVEGARLLTNAKVAAKVAELQAKRSERTEITADMVLTRWWDIATADPNELTQLRRGCCRHCYGEEHLYQWTEQEFARETAKVIEHNNTCEEGEERRLPETLGGFGFDATTEPFEDCPECFGEGRERVYAFDTRTLKGSARKLFAGVKQTQHGIEIKMQDQGKALENVARHLGMFIERQEITGKDGAPLQVKVYVPDNGRGSSRD